MPDFANINADNRGAWQHLANVCSEDRPSIGKAVNVSKGKHKGKQGVVKRHQISKFGSAYRYCDGNQAMLRDMMGRHGWVCLVEFTDQSTAWVNADYCDIVK